MISDGDFVLCSTSAAEKNQVIMVRVKTNSPDWYCHPEIGANLEDLRGERSSQQVANAGVKGIINTLTVDGYFSASDLTVDAVPEAGRINFFIMANNNGTNEPIVLNYPVTL